MTIPLFSTDPDATLGHGPHGVCHRGRDEVLQREVAVKQLLNWGELPPAGVARLGFAHWIGRRRPAGWLDVYGLDSHLGLVYTELVSGGSLRQAEEDGRRLSAEQARRLLADVLPALAWLHQAGRLHGAVCPTNLFLHADGRYRIGDGLGLTLEPAEGAGPPSAALGYTPHDWESKFIAPEMLAGRGGPAADLHSLGLSVLELMMGRAALEAHAAPVLAGAQTWAEWQASGPGWSASALQPDLPAELTGLLDRMLARASGRRLRTAAEVLAALERALPLRQRGRRAWLVGTAGALAVAAVLGAALMAPTPPPAEEANDLKGCVDQVAGERDLFRTALGQVADEAGRTRHRLNGLGIDLARAERERAAWKDVCKAAVEERDRYRAALGQEVQAGERSRDQLARAEEQRDGLKAHRDQLAGERDLFRAALGQEADEAGRTRLWMEGRATDLARAEREREALRAELAIAKDVSKVAVGERDQYRAGLGQESKASEGARARLARAEEERDALKARHAQVTAERDLFRTALARGSALAELPAIESMAAGERVRTFGGREGDVLAVRMPRKGKHVYTFCTNDEIRLYDAATGKETSKVDIKSSARIAKAAFSPDGRHLLVAHSLALVLHDTADGKVVWQWEFKKTMKSIGTLTWSADGQVVAVTDWYEGVLVLGATAGKFLFKCEKGSTPGAALSPNGQLVAVDTFKSGVEIWEVDTAKHLKTLGTFQYSDGLSFSPDGESLLVVGALRERSRLFNVNTGKAIRTLEHRPGSYSTGPMGPGVFTAGGQRILARKSGGGGLLVWDARTGKLIASEDWRAAARRPSVYADGGPSVFALSEDARYALTSKGSEVELWKVSGEEVASKKE